MVLALLTGATCFVAGARADLAEYYVGIDTRATPFDAPAAEGGGAYPNNPNYNRLTLLFQHGNHYHGIGQYVYAGPAGSPTLIDTNGNNRLPETYTGQEPLPLVPGVGVYAGKNTTKHLVGLEYSALEMQNVHSLNGAGVAEDVLFNSSSNRWSSNFDAAHIHLELVSVSSPHLNVGTLANPSAVPVGGDVHVGDGDEFFAFTPVLWVDAAAPRGTYSAEFRLVDESGTFGDSGRFFLDVQQVPEPTSVGLGGLAIAALAAVRRRRRS
ncbi:MAG: PEP-CTERM sorting domain-containing protein [Planctomycetaceae bacterium]|nr:PEP-CTERM sorting domain-containing protein [Planctomycetaceae bacterium]